MASSEDALSTFDDSLDDEGIPDKDIQGVLLVQLISLSHFNDESCDVYDHFYLQTTCTKHVKRTHAMMFSSHKEAIIDAVQHFPINIPVSMTAVKNCSLKIEMMMYKANKDSSMPIEKQRMGIILFHLMDVIHNRVIKGLHEFSDDMASIAKLELKICYVAGIFGFGYSQRLNFEADCETGDYPSNIEEQLLLSLFPRYQPPAESADDGLLTVKEVPVPDILPMFHDEQDPAGTKFMFESRWTNHPCSSLMKDCNRLRRLRLALLSCDSHHLRKVFLEKLILQNKEMSIQDIKKYKAEKEENDDQLNVCMEHAERKSSMSEPSFVRRMSSSINTDDIKEFLKNIQDDGDAVRDNEKPSSSNEVW